MNFYKNDKDKDYDKPINIKAKKVKKKNRIFRIIFLIIGYVITIDLVAQMKLH